MTRLPAQRADGFTLLELLVVLVVLGLIIVGLSQGVRFGLLAWAHSVQSVSLTDNIEPVDDTLRHLIEGIDPGDDLDPALLVGNRNSLDCTTSLPVPAGPLPRQRVQAAVLVDGEHRLVLRWRPTPRIGPRLPAAPANAVTLLEGVSSVEFAYWSGGRWGDAWRSPNLPSLVRIRLRFPTGDPRHWPDIIVAPLLDRR